MSKNAEVEEVEAEEEIEAEPEEEDEPETTNAYPCPTCGMLFSELTMCEKHAQFCLVPDDPGVEWSDERILLLIDCMQARYQRYIQLLPRERKKHWKMTGQIVGATGEEARMRWNHLTASYNRVRMAISQGRMRGNPWRFFNKMDKVLGDAAVNRPEFVLSSMPLEPDEDGSVQTGTGMLLPADAEGEMASTSRLIDIMEERYEEYSKLSPKNRKSFWREIGDVLKMPGEEVRVRWNMLVGSFKRTRQNRDNLARRYGREPKIKWRYYEQMERILGDRLNPTIPLMVISSRTLPPLSGFPLSTGANMLTASKPAGGKRKLKDIAPAPPKPSAPTSAAGTPKAAAGTPKLSKAAKAAAATVAAAAAVASPGSQTSVFKLGPNGVLQPLSQDDVPVASAPPVEATVLQAGTPQQQQADIEAFATKRKALFVEDYLRAKARREEQRLQLEERRIRALERLVDVMEGRVHP
ncbi:hypothetical protein FJT64_007741 [Amphibalanus amphitrite]|uniref:MADF domain-containing protein n=1 Tax=Amphibalanus amphitrite TaxID=1232801 RepID=A0A6A4VJD7_AMPAM|nr:hypothetical protein FJT64_007741 [Amphibalanus amphitrite]